MENIIYVYIKGVSYKDYKVTFEGNEDVKPFELKFDDITELQNFVIGMSNFYSLKIQYYL